MNETIIKNAFDDMNFDIDVPSFFKEVIECSGQRMYAKTWGILLSYIIKVATRASEINDPVLDALMLRMNLYECDFSERKKMIEECKILYEKMLKK